MILMNIFTDFFKSLTLMDYIFLLAILVVIILLIVMIYYLKINNETLEDDIINFMDFKEELSKDNDAIKEVKAPEEEIKKDPAIQDVATAISNDYYDDEEGELLDLEGLTAFIKQKEVDNTPYNEYEKEQEERAIISYDELLAKANRNVVKYLEAKQDDIVRKIDMKELVNTEVNDTSVENTKAKVVLVSYEKEEAFLETLKKLQNQLIN
ncbi:MAG: hypothetical protein IJ574_05135 [Bacilli bacterium]|nr:hypothetical protein [Bacilli bacterium]